jgi:hypothetical protein
MSLLYKPDWNEARERLAARYACEVIDRCCIHVTAPRDDAPKRDMPEPANLEEKWTDIDAVLDRAEERFRTAYYAGEAVPFFMPSLGPNVFSAWFGCPLQFAEGTTWTEPIIKDWDSFDGLAFDPENRWWHWMRKMTETAAERGKGKFLVGVNDLHPSGDGVAALRGTQEFLMDLALNPEKIKEVESIQQKAWGRVCDTLFPILENAGQDGSGGFLGWGPGRTFPLQDDTTAMMSPEMWREFFLPGIVEQARYLDNCEFHLDGPEAVCHLDTLLEIPEINGIQWQPGAANYPMTNWIDLLRRIQEAGKTIQISCRPDEVETLLGELYANGLLIRTSCPTRAGADELLKKVEAWSRTW